MCVDVCHSHISWGESLKYWFSHEHFTFVAWMCVDIYFNNLSLLVASNSLTCHWHNHINGNKSTFNWYSRRTHFRPHKLLSTNVSEIDNLSHGWCVAVVNRILYFTIEGGKKRKEIIRISWNIKIFNSKQAKLLTTSDICTYFEQKRIS